MYYMTKDILNSMLSVLFHFIMSHHCLFGLPLACLMYYMTKDILNPVPSGCFWSVLFGLFYLVRSAQIRSCGVNRRAFILSS